MRRELAWMKMPRLILFRNNQKTSLLKRRKDPDPDQTPRDQVQSVHLADHASLALRILKRTVSLVGPKESNQYPHHLISMPELFLQATPSHKATPPYLTHQQIFQENVFLFAKGLFQVFLLGAVHLLRRTILASSGPPPPVSYFGLPPTPHFVILHYNLAIC